jgi:hypothetical protein
MTPPLPPPDAIAKQAALPSLPPLPPPISAAPAPPHSLSVPAPPSAPTAQPAAASPSTEGKQTPAEDRQPDEMVTTGVDDLIKLLSEYPKLSVEEVSRRLNISKKILKSWIDFLVEEKILGIEYSFTTPYIYLNKPVEADKTKKTTEMKLSYGIFKQEFFEKARSDKIPEDKILGFWQGHLQPILDANKEFFLREAKKRNLPQGEEIWQRYVQEALSA